MGTLRDNWKTFLSDRPSRAGVLLAGGCSALLILLVILLALLIPHGAAPAADWQQTELGAGLFPPAQGTVAEVRQDERFLAVYLTDVPAEAVAPYLQSLSQALGAAFSEQAPYRAYAADRDIVVDYDPASRRLSLTIVK